MSDRMFMALLIVTAAVAVPLDAYIAYLIWFAR